METIMSKKPLDEADRPVDYATPTDIDWDTMFDEPVSKGALSTDHVNTSAAKTSGQVEVPKLKIGDKAATHAATAHMTPTDSMRDMMSKINIPDEMMDAGVDDEPPHQQLVPSTIQPDQVPAVISREIAMSDPHAVNPTWHAVANLPGNMSRAILTLGKALFKSFTRTPTEAIVMIGNVGGQGPNSTREVRSVAKWVTEKGTPVDAATIDFGVTIPGYSAEVKHYTVGSVRFMLVKDPYGDYIYAWPNGDSLDAVQQIEPPAATPPAGRRPARQLSRR